MIDIEKHSNLHRVISNCFSLIVITLILIISDMTHSIICSKKLHAHTFCGYLLPEYHTCLTYLFTIYLVGLSRCINVKVIHHFQFSEVQI